MGISSAEYFRYGVSLIGGSRTRSERLISLRRDTDVSQYFNHGQVVRVLDLANGRLRPQYTILRSRGECVVGIDVVNRPKYSGIDVAYRFARRIYQWKLGVKSESLQPKTLVCGDVSVLPFKREQFDLITSVAAFEHFLDVPAVIKELHRVLRPGGLVWVVVHLFTSLSGGHNFSLAEVPVKKVPKGIEPWDHLRKRKLPFHVPLNEWRRRQYLEHFAQRFEILKEYTASREGEELLTPDIERELSDYSRDELTARSYVIVARKST